MGMFFMDRCCFMLSSTTIESSTKIPIQRDKPIRDIIFSVNFITYIIKKVAIREVGMATSTINEDFQLFKNINKTKAVVIIPSIKVRFISVRDEVINLVLS